MCKITKHYWLRERIMEYVMIEKHKVPIIADVDFFVAGGGCAGVGAAISAGRAGLRVFLAERLFCLGGMMTAGLMSKIAIAPQNLGLATEIIQRMDELQNSNYIASRPEVPIDPEIVRAVQISTLIQRDRQIFKELDVYVNGHDIRSHHHDDVSVQRVDETQLLHDLVYGDLHRDARKQRSKREHVPYQAVPRKSEPIQYISERGTNQRGACQDKDQDQERVEKCPAHIRFLESMEIVGKIQPVFR